VLDGTCLEDLLVSRPSLLAALGMAEDVGAG